MKKQIESDEIDVVNVIINIWNNKLKIAAITIIFIVLSTAFYFKFKPPLNTTTEIIPITIFENNLYSSYNSLTNAQDRKDDKKNLTSTRFDQVNRGYLLNFFFRRCRNPNFVDSLLHRLHKPFNLIFSLI